MLQVDSGVSSYAPSVQSTSHLTQASSVDLPNRPSLYIRRTDISESLQAYERLLNASKTYTSAMLAMSKASSEMAEALEDCSRLKGAHISGPAFQAACGLHYLKSNYEQVLCDTFWKEFSIPLLSQLDVYRNSVRDRQIAHEKAIEDQSRILKEIEIKYQKEGRKKRRDLNSFRSMLSELQEKVNELEEIKAQHYTEALENEEQTWDFLASKVMLLVRAQVDIADRLSAKGINDPILESYMAAIPDPFQSYGPEKREGELFSILQPPQNTERTSDMNADATLTMSPKPLPESSRAGSTNSDYANMSSEANSSGPDDKSDRTSLFPPASQDEYGEHDTSTDTLSARVLQSKATYQSLFGYDEDNTMVQNQDTTGSPTTPTAP
ncbi:fungal-type vacuole membrane protein [Malassezia pachydermatis]|uniref:Protein IVY1 n=1 Tax=Malassezia pachydermatis TaxID=77020 RepID=A0A0M9VNM1_9BASI|nr:hypothetical protein Malapachy_0272 [Malassezia pachydermatis]KOS13493.1 hypothetical protein Malapachy_0272 [Malassezia pachydermatis]